MKIEAHSLDHLAADGEPSSSPLHAANSNALKRALVAVNCLLLALGNTGGPLLLRQYFRGGGKRQWFSSWLKTAGWPVIVLPLFLSFTHRRRQRDAKLFFLTRRLFLACATIGLLTGLDDFLYTYGLSFLPVSTSAMLISTQLAFTALFAFLFAFLIMQQRFTVSSLAVVVVMMVGAMIPWQNMSSDWPAGVTPGQYYKGFVLTLGAAALYGLVLPLVELTYARTEQAITYTLVMEMQLVMGFFATGFCTVGMLINSDFQAIAMEARNYELGEARYYVVVVWCAIFWQCFFLGTVGVIFCVHTLLAGILIAVFIPATEVLAVIFFKEKFTPEKAVAPVIALLGLGHYFLSQYQSQYQENKEKKKKEKTLMNQNNNTAAQFKLIGFV